MNVDEIRAMDPKRVVVLDTETTGLNPDKTDEILSLTIIGLDGTVIFNELVKPEKRKRWPKAQEVHGITPAMVEDKKPIVAYQDELQELWSKIDLIVGYNVMFDTNFIYLSGLSLKPHPQEFDVMKEFAPVFGEWDERHGNYRWPKLVQCAQYYKVGGFEAHTSLGDTEATRQCFIALINDAEYINRCREKEAKAIQAKELAKQKADEEEAARAKKEHEKELQAKQIENARRIRQIERQMEEPLSDDGSNAKYAALLVVFLFGGILLPPLFIGAIGVLIARVMHNKKRKRKRDEKLKKELKSLSSQTEGL